MLSKSLFGMIGTPYNALPAAVQAEVAYRRRTFSMTDALSGQIGRMAAWLTDDSARFAAVLCGGCGNGKTTLIKAVQNLLGYLNIPIPDGHGKVWGLRLCDAKETAYLARTNYESFLSLMRVPMLAVDDAGIEPLEVRVWQCGQPYCGAADEALRRAAVHPYDHQPHARRHTQAIRRPHCRPAQRNGGSHSLQEPLLQNRQCFACGVAISSTGAVLQEIPMSYKMAAPFRTSNGFLPHSQARTVTGLLYHFNLSFMNTGHDIDQHNEDTGNTGIKRERRDSTISFRVSTTQREHIGRLADKCGMTLIDYVLTRSYNYRPKARLTSRQEAVRDELVMARSDYANTPPCSTPCRRMNAGLCSATSHGWSARCNCSAGQRKRLQGLSTSTLYRTGFRKALKYKNRVN